MLTIKVVAVGPRYPECLYTSTPKWIVSYEIKTDDGETIACEKVCETEAEAKSVKF